MDIPSADAGAAIPEEAVRAEGARPGGPGRWGRHALVPVGGIAVVALYALSVVGGSWPGSHWGWEEIARCWIGAALGFVVALVGLTWVPAERRVLSGITAVVMAVALLPLAFPAAVAVVFPTFNNPVVECVAFTDHGTVHFQTRQRDPALAAWVRAQETDPGRREFGCGPRGFQFRETLIEPQPQPGSQPRATPLPRRVVRPAGEPAPVFR